MKIVKNKRQLIIDLVICLSFLILSLFYVFLFLKKGLLMVGSDRMFHLERMEETYENLRHGHFISYISTFSFGRVGQAIGIFYPSFNLTIYAIVRFIIKNQIHAIYGFILIEQFIGLMVAYFSGKVVLKNTRAAYLFAIILRFSNYVLYNDFARFDVGESWSLVFLPMILAGLYIILNNDQWKGSILLSLGLILEFSCHILTTIITIIFIVVCYIFYFFIVSKRWQSLYKLICSAIIFVLGSLFVSVPIISTLLTTPINKPDQNPLSEYDLTLGKLLSNSLNNSLQMTSTVNIGLILVITLTLGFTFIKYESKLMNDLYLAAVAIVILSTSLFPWKMFSKTFLATLQYPWRLLLIAIILLSLYLADILVKSSNSWLIIALVLALIMTLTVGAEQSFITNESNDFALLQNNNQKKNAWGFILDKTAVEQVKSKNMSDSLSARSLDYLPIQAKKNQQIIFDHMVQINGNKVALHNSQIKSGYQSINYQLNLTNKKAIVNIPFLIYNRKNYRVYQNGKEVPFKVNKYSTVQVVKSSGISHIHYAIKFRTPTLWRIANYISLITIVASLAILVFQLKPMEH